MMDSQTNEVKFKNSESLLKFCYSDKATHKKAELYKKGYYIYVQFWIYRIYHEGVPHNKRNTVYRYFEPTMIKLNFNSFEI